MIKVEHDSYKSEGISLLDDEIIVYLQSRYENGSMCGIENHSLIVQRYVNDPLLLDFNNKFDFRVYVLIASTNPLILFYHDGFLRVALNQYDKTSIDKSTHLTNTYLAEKMIAEAKRKKIKINGMDEKELKNYHLWDFPKFQKYLLESEKVNDPNWLDSYLRPTLHKAVIHLMRMASDAFWKQSNAYQLLSLDFMLDDNFNLWFIEGNPNPQLAATNSYLGRLLRKMLKDLHEIQFGLYKSRMTRIFKAMQKMQKEQEKGDVDYKKWQAEYKKAASNKFEPQYKPSKTNSFVLVLDESIPGVKGYQGNLKAECILP